MRRLELDAMNASPHILIVDNQRSIRFSVRLSLESIGYAVTVRSMEAAFEALQANSTPYDLLIADFQIETMNCTDFISKLRTYRNDLPILLLVGTRCRKEIEKLSRLPAIHLLQKPLDRSRLFTSVQTVLGGNETDSSSKNSHQS